VDTNSFQQPTPLPSLTPFPTPTPQATPVNERDSGIVAANTENGGGLLGELSAIETGRFRDAFWRGVTITGYLFGALGIYLLFRAILRRLWRYLWVKISN
jgi:hypothetical protein